MKPCSVLSAVACILAGAALAVSLLHAGPAGPGGPQGPAGPQGQTGRNAEVAHLGFCDVGMAASMDVPVLLPPVLIDGVASCPNGSFVSIVPQPAS